MCNLKPQHQLTRRANTSLGLSEPLLTQQQRFGRHCNGGNRFVQEHRQGG